MDFKDYNQSQLFLFPPTFEDLIPKNHSVRIVNEIIENIKLEPLLKAYKKEVNPSYLSYPQENLDPKYKLL